MIKNGLHTNEIVFRGHPDKCMDQIANAILKYCLSVDPSSRVGIDGAGGKRIIFLTGEVRTAADLGDDIVESLAKQAMINAGMTPEDVSKYKIINNIGQQSADIAQGVDKDGAGDQGIVFGYSERNGSGYDLPIAMWILQELSKQYNDLCRRDKRFKSDGKAQITAEYRNNELVEIKDFVIAYQNTEQERRYTDQIIKDMVCGIICGIIYRIDSEAGKCKLNSCPYYDPNFSLRPKKWHINATGKFQIGGFEGDAGEIGRKIVIDQTQGFSKVGGGCVCGKDPSKVDFSGIHAARKIAQRYIKEHSNVLSAEAQIGYVIGENKPTNVTITAQYRDGNGDIKEYSVDGIRADYEDASVTNCKKVGLGLTDKLVELAAYGQFVPEKI